MIIVTDIESGQLLKTYNYGELLKICSFDKEMCDDYIRFLRKRGGTHINKRHEIWQIIN